MDRNLLHERRRWMKVGEARGLGFEAEGGLLVELFAEQVQAVAGERA